MSPRPTFSDVWKKCFAAKTLLFKIFLSKGRRFRLCYDDIGTGDILHDHFPWHRLSRVLSTTVYSRKTLFKLLLVFTWNSFSDLFHFAWNFWFRWFFIKRMGHLWQKNNHSLRPLGPVKKSDDAIHTLFFSAVGNDAWLHLQQTQYKACISMPAATPSHSAPWCRKHRCANGVTGVTNWKQRDVHHEHILPTQKCA